MQNNQELTLTEEDLDTSVQNKPSHQAASLERTYRNILTTLDENMVKIDAEKTATLDRIDATFGERIEKAEQFLERASKAVNDATDQLARLRAEQAKRREEVLRDYERERAIQSRTIRAHKTLLSEMEGPLQ